jgi:hypothetical protein
VCVCACGLSYPACKAHSPFYIAICGLSGSTKLFQTISKQNDFRGKKMLLDTKCVFWFSPQLLSESFLILRRIERHFIINVHWSSRKVLRYSCQILMHLEFSLLLASCLQTCMTYIIAECTSNNSWWWTEECPKHVEFQSKINLSNKCI